MSLNTDGTYGGKNPAPTQTRPYDFGTDAIERQRVSLGQAMMDADFEYGLQATKWQSYTDVRKYPSFFEVPGTDFTFSNVVSDGAGKVASNITVYYANVVPAVGSYISMFGLTNQHTALADRAEGYFLITAANSTSNTANYLAKSWVPSGNIQSALTFTRKANLYNSGQITIPFTNIWSDGGSNLQIYTSNAHGLLPGTPLLVNNLGNAGYANFFGTFFVSNVTSANSFNIVANTYIFGSSAVLNSANLLSSNMTLVVSQFASTQHRPYDGGVLLSTLSPAHGSTVIRQSKKAFRYQSGKGILFSSGTLFCPNLDIASVSLAGPSTTTTTSNPFGGTASPQTLNVASTTGFIAGQILSSYIGAGLGTVTITSVLTATTMSIAWSSGVLFPSGGIPVGTTIATLPAGSNLTLVTDVAHGIPTTGATATIRNFTTTAINGTGYMITGVTDSRTVNVQTQQVLTTSFVSLGEQPRLVMTNWHGSTVRAGTFEDPNGLFWEYDGQTLSVVRRQSTFQSAGYITVNPLSQTLLGTSVPGVSGTIVANAGSIAMPTTAIGDTQAVITLTGAATHTVQQYMTTTLPGLGYVWVVGQVDFFQITIGFLPTTAAIPIIQAQLAAAVWSLPTTRFQDQFKVNDRFTVRGMVHQVTSIQGQGVMTFNPPYRGASAISVSAPVKACKIKELRVPQSQFNRDTIDGMGPSGYKVDLSRQQMIGIQYTWYGAGFVDFMIRGPDGNWIMCHRIKNNNVNDEAYMRSGNLPVRYELSVECRAAVSTLASNVNTTQTTLTINDSTTFFPAANAYLLVDNEYIYYTGTTPNSFTGCQRAQPITYVINDTSRTFTGQAASTHLANTSVNLISCSATPTMTHWGSSFLTDGQFDFERGYYFNYSNTQVSIAASPNPSVTLNGSPAFAVRLAPSVTNGLVGDIGQKELLNRAQLLLQKLEVTSPNNIVTVGFLNPSNVYFQSSSWININTQANGTQPSFAQYYPGNLITTVPQPGERIFQTIVQANNQNNLDLGTLKEMANSAIGGNQPFPDGPDVLLVYCQNLSTVPVTAQVNLFWSEAQA
jgi:hypothetical protein